MRANSKSLYTWRWRMNWPDTLLTSAGWGNILILWACAWSAGVHGRAWSFSSELLIPSQHFVTLSHLSCTHFLCPQHLLKGVSLHGFKGRYSSGMEEESIYGWSVKRPQLSQETPWSCHSWSLGTEMLAQCSLSYFLSFKAPANDYLQPPTPPTVSGEATCK